MKQSAIFITHTTPGAAQEVQIGPFRGAPDAPLIGRWARDIRTHIGVPRPDCTVETGPFRPGDRHVDPERIPTAPGAVAGVIDDWDPLIATAYGAEAVGLFPLLVARLGSLFEARRVWDDANRFYEQAAADTEDEDGPELSSDLERDRVARLINADLDSAAGNPEPGDTPGHVAYDAVMAELTRRTEGRPGGPAREVMTMLLELFGVVHLLDGLTGCGRVPFEGNIAAAEHIAEHRALLTEMIMAGSCRIESALAAAGMVTVSVHDLENEGVPADVVAKLRARMEALR